MSRRGTARGVGVAGRARRLVCHVAVSSALAVAVSTAHADTPPSFWDIARDPSARARWALHVRVMRLLHAPAGEDPMEPEQRPERMLSMARALLEDADAAHSPDVRLRFDLGAVYERLATLSRRDDLERKAVEVLAPALQLAPDHPASVEAYQVLAEAYAQLDRPQDELATWRGYIARVTSDRARVTALMNMGEAQMRLGLLDDALVTFRDGLQLCETLATSGVNKSYALTLWDLALALDRSGDPAAAVATAAKARTWTWTGAGRRETGWDAIRDDDDVFFVPGWEREWYLALGFASAAWTATDPRDAARMWARAEKHWDSYVAHASAAPPEHDRWLPIARARLAHAHEARMEAERRSSRLPPRAPTGGENWPED
ncbi:MAG TPA: hypothetical protein VEK07_19440 [Polyangiaceae bacterium]|nr:hypothetical protein [Polyangiaceae bacterium]